MREICRRASMSTYSTADFDEVEKLILDGRISEDRSIAMIFKYIMEQKKIAE